MEGDRRNRHTRREVAMPTTTAPIYDWTQAVMTSAVAALAMFLGAIPKVLGFLVILLIGWLIALTVAFDALGLPAVSQVLQQVLLFIPNVIVALMVLVIGGLLANALAGLVRGATGSAGLGNPDLLGNIARIAVWGFAIVIAV